MFHQTYRILWSRRDSQRQALRGCSQSKPLRSRTWRWWLHPRRIATWTQRRTRQLKIRCEWPSHPPQMPPLISPATMTSIPTRAITVWQTLERRSRKDPARWLTVIALRVPSLAATLQVANHQVVPNCRCHRSTTRRIWRNWEALRVGVKSSARVKIQITASSASRRLELKGVYPTQLLAWRTAVLAPSPTSGLQMKVAQGQPLLRKKTRCSRGSEWQVRVCVSPRKVEWWTKMALISHRSESETIHC